MNINRNMAAKALIITALVTSGAGAATANVTRTNNQTNLTQGTRSATTKYTVPSTSGNVCSQSVTGAHDTSQ